MSASLLDLSGKIDEITVGLFQEINDAAKRNNIGFFAIGAKARDIILNVGYGLQSNRATEDIDLGIQILNWEKYKQFIDGLISTGKFREDRQVQRIIFRDQLLVDIIPFGLIKDKNDNITWPPDHNTQLNIMGFEEAFDHAQMVRLRSEPILDIRFVTLAGLALLKLIAWKTGHEDRKQKDATDLEFLFSHYSQAGNEDRLYNDFSNVLEKYEFDLDLAGAYLLGFDVSRIAQPNTLQCVIEILSRETNENGKFNLISDMIKSRFSSGEIFDSTLSFLSAFKEGIEVGLSRSV